jgi:hypothetical protein
MNKALGPEMKSTGESILFLMTQRRSILQCSQKKYLVNKGLNYKLKKFHFEHVPNSV